QPLPGRSAGTRSPAPAMPARHVHSLDSSTPFSTNCECFQHLTDGTGKTDPASSIALADKGLQPLAAIPAEVAHQLICHSRPHLRLVAISGTSRRSGFRR